jgi:hypothetical protein
VVLECGVISMIQLKKFTATIRATAQAAGDAVRGSLDERQDHETFLPPP